MSVTLPSNTALTSFELLAEVPGTLEAGEVFVLPYLGGSTSSSQVVTSGVIFSSPVPTAVSLSGDDSSCAAQASGDEPNNDIELQGTNQGGPGNPQNSPNTPLRCP